MKPNPFESLNHFTVPVAIFFFLQLIPAALLKSPRRPHACLLYRKPG
jgi:hypothetical protein